MSNGAGSLIDDQLGLPHVLQVGLHWLLIPIAAGMALWLLALLLALAGWTVWGGVWLTRRVLRLS